MMDLIRPIECLSEHKQWFFLYVKCIQTCREEIETISVHVPNAFPNQPRSVHKFTCWGSSGQSTSWPPPLKFRGHDFMPLAKNNVTSLYNINNNQWFVFYNAIKCILVSCVRISLKFPVAGLEWSNSNLSLHIIDRVQDAEYHCIYDSVTEM